jgi:hypothetical protein
MRYATPDIVSDRGRAGRCESAAHAATAVDSAEIPQATARIPQPAPRCPKTILVAAGHSTAA